MNLKLRFALLFCLFTGLALSVFSFIAHSYYDKQRETVFYDRLKTSASWFYNNRSWENGVEVMTDSASRYPGMSHVFLSDHTGKLLFRYPEDFNPAAGIDTVIRQEKELTWTDDTDNQYVAWLQPDGGRIVAGGYDVAGYSRLSRMRFSLMLLVLTGVALSIPVAFLICGSVLRPLRRLSGQMHGIYLRNANERLPAQSQQEMNDLARKFNAMLDRVDNAAELQKNFVFHASHEFRTPLATMLSETESALAQPLTEAGYREVLASLKEEQQALIELTSSLLLLSQSDNRDFTRDWTLLRIDEVLYDTISRARKFFPGLEIDMSFASFPDDPDDLLVRGDESLLRSAFLNLVKNGYMYSIDQKVNVLLEFAGDTLLIHFDNTGTQLPADEKANITEPFFRGSNALKTKGYGLGLSVVNRVVVLLGGSVQYMAIANDVNRFTITLSRYAARAMA